MIKVLFLDIDGVVLHGQALWQTGNNRHLPSEKVALVREVCDRAGALVVVSSTWRHSDETRSQLAAVGLPLHHDWRTPFGREMVGSIIIGKTRGSEIAEWLAAHPEVSAYAIVDDDGDMLPSQLPRFVQTPFETGIDRPHVEALIACLASADTHPQGGDSAQTEAPFMSGAVPSQTADAQTLPHRR